MTLHPHLTSAELSAYCELCHEHGIKSVKVDANTAGAIQAISFGLVFMGIKFKVKQ